ncbi:MAG: hypothetical protein EBS01_14255, partial [Verrucomicrobia bacterium]|nr:hypothetical protein [Verrucomicrobiota bacterium]
RFGSTAKVSFDSIVALIVESGTMVGFGANVTAGSVTVGSGGLVTDNVTFSGTTTVTSLNVTTSGAEATATFASIRVGAGGAVITANNIDFLAGRQVTATNSAATLTLKPYDAGRAVGVGNLHQAPGEILDIGVTDLLAIKTGFAAVNFGDALAGTGTAYIGFIGVVQASANFARFLNPTHIYGGSVVVNQVMDVTASASVLHLVARTGDVTVNGAINAANLTNTTYSERNAWVLFQAAGNIFVNQPVYASDRISLIAGMGAAGSGSITVSAVLGNSGLLATIGTSGSNRRIELVAGETSGDLVITSATVTAAGTSGAVSSVVLRANGGGIAQSAGLITASTLAFWAKGAVVLNTSVDTLSTLTLDGTLLAGGSGATATATLSNGSVGSLNLLTGGSGYSVAPTVTIFGDAQVLATGSATISGPVSRVLVTSGGSGYSSAPTVSFSGGSGLGATGTAVVLNGSVVSVTVTGGGSAYQSEPTVAFSGGGGTGAAARAFINGTVVGISLSVAGSGYTFTPTVVIGTGASSVVINGGQSVGAG